MTLPDSDPHAWLETDAIRRVSDLALGVIMLVVGAFALWVARDYPTGSLTRVGPGMFPTVVAGLLCLVGVVLLLRAALRRSPPFRHSRPLHVAIVAAVIVIFGFAIPKWGVPLFLRFGPAEFTAFIALEVALAIALAHTSRTRAAGMVILGLLLSTVGTDVNSGYARFTMGLELTDGIGVEVVLFGLFVFGDAVVCLASPPLFLRTYARLVTAWRGAPRIRAPAVLIMRLVAALALAGACYYVYALLNSVVDVVLTLVFGALGVAAKILGWNRFLLCIGIAFGALLEENIRRALLLAQGDPSMFLQRPISSVLIIAAAAILTTAVVHSVRRASTAGRA